MCEITWRNARVRRRSPPPTPATAPICEIIRDRHFTVIALGETMYCPMRRPPLSATEIRLVSATLRYFTGV